jgi:peptidyl-prolyl cis-trans isomerase D
MGALAFAQGRIAFPMLTFFRRFAASPIGIAVFAVILIAFVVTLYEGKSMFGGGLATGGALANVGGKTIGEAEALRRTQTQLEGARQEKPDLDMATFVAQGGAEQTIDQMINGRAFELFAAANGLVASRKLVDGAIASIAAFNGPNGQFDRATYLNILAQRKIPEGQLREDFGREAITKMLLVPVAGGAKVPLGLAQPYAALLLEQRQGQIGVVPSASFASNAPLADLELTDFYQKNIGRYTVPERRIIKIAQFDRKRFEGAVTPSEAEIAAAYKAGGGKYAGRETRSFTQIIVQGQAEANALLAKVKGGISMADAAKSLGLEALGVPTTDKAAFEKLTGPRVAEAAFSAPKGGYAALAQSGLGFHIVRVDSVAAVAATTLDQARGALVADLTKSKTDEALSDFVAKIEDDINGGATFDDIAKKYGLAASATPAITASGIAPDVQDFAFPADQQPLLKDAFQADPGDDPQVASIGNGTSYTLYHMDRVIPSAPKALADIRNQVMADAQVDRASRAAKRVADTIAANVNKGMAFQQALAGAGVKLPAPRPAGGRRIDIAQAKEKVPPPLAMMFGMAEKRAKVLAVPLGAGWFIVYLDKITPGDAQQAQPLIAATQAQLSRVVGDEYVQQFASAIKAQVGVSRNAAAIAAFKKSLTGGAAGR